MNPGGSTIDTVDGEREVKQHVEASMSDSIKLPCKRKAETSLVADSVDDNEGSREEEEHEDNERSRQEEEHEDNDSVESDQVWGVDSFDEPDDESSEGEPEDTDEEEMRRYSRHIAESKGFLVEKEMIPKNLFQGLVPLKLDAVFKSPNITSREYMETMARVAIDKYNQTMNKTLTLDHLVRVVIKMSTGVKAYITFMAKESPEGELVEYQAKSEKRVWQTKIHPILCRPTSSSSS